jgi:putative addiction module component (TIGR02574 family)
MSRNASQLLQDALRLPEDQRVELACELLDSLEPGPPGSDRTEEEWITEIERRVQAALDGEPGIPWEEAKAELYKRLGRG